MRISERFPRETGREYALRMLRENIVSLALEPGAMVSENELAAQLGLSRTPVREALIELSKAKIVEIYPQRGSAVAPIDCEMVEEASFMRLVLEQAVVQQVCERATPPQLAELESNVKLQEFYLAEKTTDKLMELDNAFHRMLFVIAGKEHIYELMNSITVHFDRVRTLSLTTVRDLKIVADHRALLEAVMARDANTARELTAKHLTRYRIDEAEMRRQYPAYFK